MTDALDRLTSALASRYTIERELGRGGMAVVYLAEDVKHARHVAVKVLLPELAATLGGDRFLQEIRVTAKLTHPHILTLIDSGEADGLLYYVMPYVEGESLRDRLKRETQLPVEDALRITEQVASALAFAHRHDVIHRDIKPENILLHEGEAMVADFGIALAVKAAGGERLTETGLSIGTPEYMSPEQVTADQLDARSDLYALGCVLYEMLAGEPPFTGRTAQVVFAKRFSDPVPSVKRLREQVPAAVDSALQRALSRTPADRFESVKVFAEALVSEELESRAPDEAIAVLPFANLSPDPDDEYLSDGISEEIINSLANVPGLQVIARTSAFAFKGTNKDVREIAAQLGVNRVLEGSVRRSGQKLRVTAQLVRAEDGHHLWSERFDRGTEDIFAIQDEIAAAIAMKLSPDGAGAAPPRQSGGTANRDAYELYLRGRYSFGKQIDEGYRQAAEYFERARSLDPSFAQAHAAYAEAQVRLCLGFGVLAPKDAIPKAREAAKRAIAIAPDLPDGHAVLAQVATFCDWDRGAAKNLFDIALSLGPDAPAVLVEYGRYLTWLEGNHEAALEALDRALVLNPLELFTRGMRGYVHYNAGNLERASEEFAHILAVESNDVLAHYGLGDTYLCAGRTDDAIAEIERAIALGGRGALIVGLLAYAYGLAGRVDECKQLIVELEDRVAVGGSELCVGIAYVGLGDLDRAFEWWDRGVRERDPQMIYLTGARALDCCKSDSRYKGLLEKMGLGHLNR